MSTFFSVFIIVGTGISLLGFFLLLHMNRTTTNPGKTTGHEFDGIEEYDNPLPAWWYWWFVLTIIFALGYLAYYPGLGNFKGLGGWTQISQLEESQQIAAEKYGPIYARYRDMSLDDIAATPAGLKMGKRMFATNCSVCHGAKGEGSFGFPNLTDDEWLWGGADDNIVTSITHGRRAGMMAWESILSDSQIDEVAEYVLQQANRDVAVDLAAKGEQHFITYCVACHGADGKGNIMLGAPDLTNESWLYGNSRMRIVQVIRKGRNGVMPGFESKLSDDKIRIVAAYVKSLSQ